MRECGLLFESCVCALAKVCNELAACVVVRTRRAHSGAFLTHIHAVVLSSNARCLTFVHIALVARCFVAARTSAQRSVCHPPSSSSNHCRRIVSGHYSEFYQIPYVYARQQTAVIYYLYLYISPIRTTFHILVVCAIPNPIRFRSGGQSS